MRNDAMRPDLTTAAGVMTHLASGNERQRSAARALKQSGLMELLAAYHPYPAGTVPIDIDVPGSDIDLLCEAEDLKRFRAVVHQALGDMEGFQCTPVTRETGVPPYVVCSVSTGGWPVEIFAQSMPVRQQNAYRHMLVEWALLTHWGREGHKEIRRLKNKGMKTEPAFAYALGLSGDPYAELLNLADKSDEELADLVRSRPVTSEKSQPSL